MTKCYFCMIKQNKKRTTKNKIILVPPSWRISFPSFKMYMKDDPLVNSRTQQLCKIQDGKNWGFFINANSQWHTSSQLSKSTEDHDESTP